MATKIAALRKEVREAVVIIRQEVFRTFSSDNAWKEWKAEKAAGKATEMLGYDEKVHDFQELATLVERKVAHSDISTSLTLLYSLVFDQLDFRHSKVREAHPNIFDWMFSNRLQSGSSLPMAHHYYGLGGNQAVARAL
jgi:hypothetical protein